MKENDNLILEVGADGGSIKLFKFKGYYLYTTNENIFEYASSSKSQKFESFINAFYNMKKEYPVFELYPVFVHEDYIDIIVMEYFDFTESCTTELFNDDSWKKVLTKAEKHDSKNFKINNMKVVLHGGQTVNISEVKNIKLSNYSDIGKRNTIVIEFKTRYEYIYNPNIKEYEMIEMTDVAEEVFPDWESASAYFHEWRDIWQDYLDRLY